VKRIRSFSVSFPAQRQIRGQKHGGIALFLVIEVVLGGLCRSFPAELSQLRPAWVRTLLRDSVWPLIVAAGLVWSFSFIPAGVIDHALAGRGVARTPRNLSYFVVLWIGAVAAWLFLIATNLPPLRH
jgi:hypothetical protein